MDWQAFCSSFVFTDYGRQMKPFFIKITNFWAWADKFLGLWAILAHLSAPILGYSESMLFINQPIFLQKTKTIYPSPKYLFGIRIRFWATKIYEFSHCVSVLRSWPVTKPLQISSVFIKTPWWSTMTHINVNVARRNIILRV